MNKRWGSVTDQWQDLKNSLYFYQVEEKRHLQFGQKDLSFSNISVSLEQSLRFRESWSKSMRLSHLHFLRPGLIQWTPAGSSLKENRDITSVWSTQASLFNLIEAGLLFLLKHSLSLIYQTCVLWHFSELQHKFSQITAALSSSPFTTFTGVYTKLFSELKEYFSLERNNDFKTLSFRAYFYFWFRNDVAALRTRR